MELDDEQAMLDLGARLVGELNWSKLTPIELVGDVGAGKTTLVRGLAQALGISEAVTSPSFTISKQYAFRLGSNNATQTSSSEPTYRLVHYDFYRLADPGLMQEDLLENLADPYALVVIEWAETVSDILPVERTVVKITTLENGGRRAEIIKGEEYGGQ